MTAPETSRTTPFRVAVVVCAGAIAITVIATSERLMRLRMGTSHGGFADDCSVFTRSDYDSSVRETTRRRKMRLNGAVRVYNRSRHLWPGSQNGVPAYRGF